jgi:toxin secretion/phage lysis holin
VRNLNNVFKTIVAGVGAVLGYLYGGWSALLGILLAFIIIDYITGVIASALEGRLSSQVGFKGIAKKVMIFVIVAVSHLADKAMGLDSVLMSAAIFFYLANELLSILENSGRIGLPVPSILQKAIALLKEKGGEEIE